MLYPARRAASTADPDDPGAWGGRTVARRTFGANHVTFVPEMGGPSAHTGQNLVAAMATVATRALMAP